MSTRVCVLLDGTATTLWGNFPCDGGLDSARRPNAIYVPWTLFSNIQLV